MRRTAAIVLLMLIALLGAAGCGAQGEIDPVPTPMGKPDEGLVLLSSSASLRDATAAYGEGMVGVFGFPGALPPDVRVVVENLHGSFSVEALVSPDGSFAATLPAAAGDPLRIHGRIRKEGEHPIDGPALERPVPPAEEGVVPGEPKPTGTTSTGAQATLIRAFVPDGSSEAWVMGEPGAVDPGVEVVIGNVSASRIATVVAGADGSFQARIPAERGDLLSILARRADAALDDPTGASSAITLPIY